MSTHISTITGVYPFSFRSRLSHSIQYSDSYNIHINKDAGCIIFIHNTCIKF